MYFVENAVVASVPLFLLAKVDASELAWLWFPGRFFTAASAAASATAWVLRCVWYHEATSTEKPATAQIATMPTAVRTMTWPRSVPRNLTRRQNIVTHIESELARSVVPRKGGSRRPNG